MAINQQNHVFLDPEECGSSVGYYLTLGDYTGKNTPTEYYVSGTVVLTDCNHKIDWSFSDRSDPEKNLAKIDAAIQMFQEFRKKMVESQKSVSKLNKSMKS